MNKKEIIEHLNLLKGLIANTTVSFIQENKPRKWLNDNIDSIYSEFKYIFKSNNVSDEKLFKFLSTLNEKELKDLGFCLLNQYFLIPKWLYPLIPKWTLLYGIDGEPFIVGVDIPDIYEYNIKAGFKRGQKLKFIDIHTKKGE